MLTQIFNRYSYCLNNPLKYVDPSGESWLYGWFENEITGDLYYDRDLGRGQEYLIDGNGWKFLGENNMFGTSSDKLFYSNYNMAEIYAGSEFGLARAAFKGKNAVTFMEKMGYMQVPMQIIEYEKSNPQPTSIGSNTRGSYDIGCISLVETEKVGYVPKNYNCSDSYQIGKSLYKSTNLGFSTMTESVTRKGLTYRECSLIKGIGTAMQTIGGGKHGPNSTGGCIPNMKMVEEFKKTR